MANGYLVAQDILDKGLERDPVDHKSQMVVTTNALAGRDDRKSATERSTQAVAMVSFLSA